MLGWPIPSAVFIDYENVAYRVLPGTIANWVAWLERGEFDASRKRRKFLLKRIYWNSSANHLREKFEHHDFQPIVCEKFTGLKNGADIKMAIDVIEATWMTCAYESSSSSREIPTSYLFCSGCAKRRSARQFSLTRECYASEAIPHTRGHCDLDGQVSAGDDLRKAGARGGT